MLANGVSFGMTDRMNPMKEPLIKPSHRGLLHKKLGVPEGKTIPPDALAKALRSGSPALRKEASFAKTAKGWKH